MPARGYLRWFLATAALFAGVLGLAAVVADSTSAPQDPVDQAPSASPPLRGEPPPPAPGALPELRLEVDDPITNGPVVDGDLRLPGYTGEVGVEARADSSLAVPKRSYRFELKSPAGGDRDAPLLGMPADGDWVLHAHYVDGTLMRNALAYATARAVGRYAPRTRFVELFLNDRYRGVYVLTEQPELGDRRVAGDALLELTSLLAPGDGGEAFRTPVRGRPVVWSDPDREELEDDEAEALQRLVGRAERALYTPPFGEPDGGWRRFLDESAAIDFALVNELFKSREAFDSTTYLARGADGRLALGPVWGFEAAMGNRSAAGDDGGTGWALADRDWAERLYRDPAFTRTVALRWTELRDRGLRERLLARVDRHRALLRGEAERDLRRWRRPPGSPPAAAGAAGRRYEEGVDDLRRWLLRRIAWLDAHVERLGEP